MEISEKQLKANQNNAKLGGVKTEEGKDIIRLNALKHGLLTKEIFISGENREEFDNLVFSIINELSPEGEIDKLLAERIITNIWRLRRVLSIERNAIEYNRNDQDLGLFDNEKQKNRKKELKIIDSGFIDKLLRYEVSIERSLYSAIREYKNNKNGFV